MFHMLRFFSHFAKSNECEMFDFHFPSTHFSDLLIKFTLESSMCFVSFRRKEKEIFTGKVLNKLQWKQKAI